MALRRFFLAAVTAAVLGACAASHESAGDRQQLSPPGSAAANQPAAPTKESSVAPDQAAVLQKVALSLSSVSDPTSKAYKIGPRDVLEVTVFKVPELSKVVQVSEAGTISYPLIGEVQAAGRTAREVEQDLTKSLGAKYLQNPQVSVFIKEYNSQRITVEGAVKKPGVYPIVGSMSLLQATATAGGFEDAASQTVLVFRQTNGKRYAAKYDVASIREGAMEDPQLQAGDVIIAPTSDVKEGMTTVLKLLPLAYLAPLL